MMNRRNVGIITVGLLLLFSNLAYKQPSNSKKNLPVARPQALIESVGATQLAEAMDIYSTDLISATIGLSDPRGVGLARPEANARLGFFPRQGNSFTILSTGLAESADDPDTNNNEIPFTGGFSDDVNHVLSGLNNSSDQDLVQLSLVLKPPPGKTSLSFDFAFYSEEFPDWIGLDFNDVFIAELGAEPFASQIVVDGTTVTAPHNIAFDPNGEFVSVNARFGFDPAEPNPDTNTTYDGTSGLLRATGCLPPERPTGNVVLILSITDLADSQIDSAVFLDNFQWGNPVQCNSGAQQLAITLTPESAAKPVGLTHTVTASIFDNQGAPISNQLIGFNVGGANNAAGQGTSSVSGQADFSYVGNNVGEDTVTAWIDKDGDSVQDADESSKSVTMVWQHNASLTITKEVTGADDGQTFRFTGDLGDFFLVAGETIVVENLAPGNYRVIETALPPLWELLGVRCNGLPLQVENFADPPGRGATVSLDQGQAIQCTFRNELANTESKKVFVSYLPAVTNGTGRSK